MLICCGLGRPREREPLECEHLIRVVRIIPKIKPADLHTPFNYIDGTYVCMRRMSEIVVAIIGRHLK